MKNVESSDKNSQAGLYRRCLSRSILALRNIKWPELSGAKTQVEKLYNEAYDFYTKNKISTADLEAVWSVYKKEFDDVKIINAESAKHKVVDGESYWSIASKYCPEGENVSDFVNLIKKYNRVPKDKNILGVGVLINIPLIFNEKKTNIEGVFTGSDIVNSQSSNTNSSNEKIVGNYSISASETEDFIIGEEYNGKGFYTVAKDIHAKYASPGFGITELSNKIGDLNKGVEFEVGAKITIPKIVKVEDNINTSIIENDEDKKEESDNTPIFKKMIDSGMSYTTGPIGAQGMNLKVLTFSYKLQESETLYGVAEKFDIDLRTLQEFNKISNKDAKTLQVGKEIKIPKVVYEVQSGDNLTKISQKFNLSQGTLMAMNNIELADQIKVQDKFALPGYVYTVKSGDNLTTIAKNAGISIDVLKTINGLTSTIIQPGQNLVILYNDMDYNVSSDNKITTYDDAGNKTGTQVNTGTNYTKKREYFTRDTDSKGNVVATRHVFQPTNNDKRVN